jgi:TonB family protein
MKNRKNIFISSICALVMVAGNTISLPAFAQDKQQEKKADQKIERTFIIERSGETPAIHVRAPGPQEGVVFQGPGEGFGGVWVSGVPAQGDQTFRFVSAEMSFDNKVVKGAPFSGEMVYESIQTLADGNRIVNRSSTTIYRDSEGRTRREQSFNFFGPFGGGNSDRKNILIFDPVANTGYTLDPQERTAHKNMTFARSVYTAYASSTAGGVETGQRQVRVPGGGLQGSATKRVQPTYPAVAKAAKAQGPVQVQITVDENGSVTTAEAIEGHPLLRDAALEAARQWQFKPTDLGGKPAKVQGILTFNFVLGDKDENLPMRAAPLAGKMQRIKVESKTESLGKQTIEGIEAEGERTIDTIPAGAIGNERPIEIVRERWYSPELQMVVMTRSVDPRVGETTQRLVNVVRSEPDASLFQIPSDYTIQESRPSAGTFEMKMRRPGNQ